MLKTMGDRIFAQYQVSYLRLLINFKRKMLSLQHGDMADITLIK
jgi:hypothetical protein